MKRKICLLLMILITLVVVGCDFDTNAMFDSRYGQAKKEILSQLNDPSSYEMEYYKTDQRFKTPYKIKFRARNGFGGMRINYAYATFDENGKLTNVMIFDKEKPQFEVFFKDEK